MPHSRSHESSSMPILGKLSFEDTGSAAEIAALEESFNPELVEIADEALAEFGLRFNHILGGDGRRKRAVGAARSHQFDAVP